MADKLYINNDWYFSKEFNSDCLVNGFDFSEFEKINVPHSVAMTPFNYFDESIYQMNSMYVKDINMPDEWKGKSVSITFEGAAHKASVYINGILKCTHNCGYTSFTIDISKEIYESEVVRVVVELDSSENLNQPPFGYVIDYMTYGGIYRDVYLSISEKTHIEDIFLYSEFSGNDTVLCSEITVENPDDRKLTLKQTINGELFTKDFSGREVKLESKISNVERWTLEKPVLYSVITEILDEAGYTLDSEAKEFGFRKAEFKTDGFYLNDEKVKIRGLNRHQSFPYIGYAMPASMQKYDAHILKDELGVNAVRTSHYPQSHDFISECDKLGILVFTEIPGWQHIGDDSWKNQAVINTEEMVIQYRNHPSIILWGVRINESADDDEFYKKTNEVAHKFDPTRQTGGVRALKKSSLLEDVYTYNDFVHDGEARGCEPKKKVTSDVNKPYLISEYNGHMYPTKSFDWEEHRREHAIRHANVLNSVAGESDIAGSFAWCMFDYNTHKDFGSGDRICYHGVMDMFRNEKLASIIYKCESDSLNETVLDISSSMDIGEHPGCNRGAVWIFSNADSVRMYKNDKLLKEYFPSDSPYKNLKHGPIMIDDFVGNAIIENEKFDKKLAAEIKEMMNATALYGLGKLPKRIMWLAAKAMVIHHLTIGDAVRLYNKYVGDWGGTSTVYKFEAVKNGKVVKTIVREPATKVELKCNPSSTGLCPGKTYDVCEVRILAVDENGNLLSFYSEPVSFRTEGDIEVIGPNTISLKGGMGGVYIKTTSYESGKAKLIIESPQTGDVTIDFDIERDTKWNVLK